MEQTSFVILLLENYQKDRRESERERRICNESIKTETLCSKNIPSRNYSMMAKFKNGFISKTDGKKSISPLASRGTGIKLSSKLNK